MSPTTPELDLFRTDLRARSAYAEGAGIFRILPGAVAVPASVEEVRRVVDWARREGRPLVPRGAGSSIAGGAVGSGIVVDLRERMPRTLEVDPGNSSAITSANVTHGELNERAAQHGLRLPPDPSSGAWATLGGMVSCNAAGARSVKYGSVRGWVEGLELVTADGETGWLWRGGRRGDGLQALERLAVGAAPAIRSAAELVRRRFPAVRKNASGYALDHWLGSGDDLDLLVGAEGTLALVTTVAWRLDPVPPARASMLVALGKLESLEEAVRALTALDPSAVELLDRTFLDLITLAATSVDLPEVPPGCQAILLVEFEGENGAQVRGRTGDAVRALGSLALDVVTALTPADERRLWTLRHAASPILASLPPDRRSMQVIEDGCVPLAALGEYVRSIREAASRESLTVVIFGHAGDGNVHVNVLPDLGRPDWAERVGRLYESVQASALDLGGTLSGEHGDGRLRSGWLVRQYGAEIVDLFRQVKTAFDPHGILNPGVKLDDGAPPLSRLKVGRDAAPIPDDIAQALGQIERSGGYALSRLEIADRHQDSATP
jgi:FAD/FMN-containing dehydrogenase